MPRSEWRLTHIQAFSGWRLRFAGKLRKSSEARKVGSPDLHQARMRFLVLAGCVVYGVLIGAFDAALKASTACTY